MVFRYHRRNLDRVEVISPGWETNWNGLIFKAVWPHLHHGVETSGLSVEAEGVRVGYVADGRLVEGARGVALELGHLTVRPQGRLCGCGRRGCLEAYVGGRHLLERLAEDAGPSGPVRSSEVWKLAGGRIDSLHPGLVDRACDSGDAYACELWDEVAGLLGEGVASAVTLLDPGRVVFGGTVLAGCPNLVKRTIEEVRSRSNIAALVDLEFVSALLGDFAGLVGAASVARRL